MHDTKFYIAEILQSVCECFKGVSENVFPEHRPAATQEQMEDLIVVSLPVSIDDQNVWQKSRIQIELLARNRANGVSNTNRLQEMLNGVSGKFPIVSDRYSITSPIVALKGDDGLGFTIWNVQAKLVVNTTDSYKY